jgi:hypothetical protein
LAKAGICPLGIRPSRAASSQQPSAAAVAAMIGFAVAHKSHAHTISQFFLLLLLACVLSSSICLLLLVV